MRISFPVTPITRERWRELLTEAPPFAKDEMETIASTVYRPLWLPIYVRAALRAYGRS